MKENDSDESFSRGSACLFEEDVSKCVLFLITESVEQEKSGHVFPLPSSIKDEEPKKALIALSGGIDSTALLLALAQTQLTHNLELHAAHFNHQLRGKESGEDESHCERLCREFSLPLHKGKDEKSSTRGAGANPVSEDALRVRRYDFLAKTAESIGAHCVLTGHNLDDQAETVLFRLLRGTALSGMRGIQPVRLLSPGVWLIRPLLGVPRREIARYILSRQITAREDSSNADCRYTRNFLRHEIMPVLKERFPQALRRIENFACTAGIDEDYLNAIARKHYEEQSLDASLWKVDALRPLHQAILDRIVALGLLKRNIQVTTDSIEAVRKQIDRELFAGKDRANARFSIDKTWDLIRDVHCIQWLNKTAAQTAPAQFAVKLRIPGSTPVIMLNKAIQIEECDQSSPVREQQSGLDQGTVEIAVDMSRLEKPLIFRRRQPGDFIQVGDRPKATTLKKYLHRRRASHMEEFCRATIDWQWTASHCPVLATDHEVLWVPGVGLSAKLAVARDKRPSHWIRLIDLAGGQQSIC